MPTLSAPQSTTDLQLILQKALEPLSGFSGCALLNYPDYPNIGDHLIWAGTVMLLKEVMNVDICYASSIHEFSDQQLHQKADKLPILLQGGGNFGDLWPHHQKFREQIIQNYRDRPIVVLPQSIFFHSSENLQQSALIFNAHP
ncbi:MAG: polysaccharide pyruvyl transferase family protein [Cyanobacteria bacterium J06632_3]